MITQAVTSAMTSRWYVNLSEETAKPTAIILAMLPTVLRVSIFLAEKFRHGPGFFFLECTGTWALYKRVSQSPQRLFSTNRSPGSKCDPIF